MWTTEIITWIIVIIAIEAVTEIVVSGEIFFKLRDWIHRHNNIFPLSFISALISCGYCFSVWVSFGAAWILTPIFDNMAINIIVLTFCLHRLSNAFHELISRWLKRVPFISRNYPEFDETVFDEEIEEEDHGTIGPSDGEQQG